MYGSPLLLFLLFTVKKDHQSQSLKWKYTFELDSKLNENGFYVITTFLRFEIGLHLELICSPLSVNWKMKMTATSSEILL